MIKTIAIPARLQKDTLTDAETTELESFGHQEMTAAEMEARQLEAAADLAAQAVSELKHRARRALDQTDMVALRCVKAGVAFPTEWRSYVVALRAIVAGSEAPIPVRPDYPAGT